MFCYSFILDIPAIHFYLYFFSILYILSLASSMPISQYMEYKEIAGAEVAWKDVRVHEPFGCYFTVCSKILLTY